MNCLSKELKDYIRIYYTVDRSNNVYYQDTHERYSRNRSNKLCGIDLGDWNKKDVRFKIFYKDSCYTVTKDTMVTLIRQLDLDDDNYVTCLEPSRHVGVTCVKSGKYVARFKNKHIGTFTDELTAALAVQNVKSLYEQGISVNAA